MTDQNAQTELVHSDNITNVEILTNGINHIFFDAPPETANSIDINELPLSLNGNSGSMEQMLYQTNSGDSALSGIFGDDELTSNSSAGSSVSSSDSDLTDSSELELEFSESDDEQLGNMLQKHLGYVDSDSDSSDLTEVSSLSSLSTSLLLLGFYPGGNVGADVDMDKPNLPLFISTTERIIWPGDDVIGGDFDEDYDEMLMMQLQNEKPSNEIKDAFDKPDPKMKD